jgi:hypothetical protein
LIESLLADCFLLHRVFIWVGWWRFWSNLPQQQSHLQ